MSHWAEQSRAAIEHERTRFKGSDTLAKTRKDRFADLNAWIMSRSGAWLVSIPGDVEIVLECLPSSTVPDELAEQGYAMREIGEGQRILPHAITETVITEEGAARITVTHSGIVRVVHYSFPL
ncbi:hypothetical protein AB7645_05470 [Bradyrhizobium sp. 956_D2_N1_5]|uniref:hypothetical protein n=1 Tax=unclassified Bradyrhizobium TaxID=2631580 RepID=UPI003F267693